MTYSPIVTSKVTKGWMSHQTNLGIESYDLNESYSPDTALWKSRVLDLPSPKYQPNNTYWFDKSRYRNLGTISGATWGRLPSGLWVLSFDGDDYVGCGAGASLNITGTALSLEVWVKPSTLVGYPIVKANSVAVAPFLAYGIEIAATGKINFNADFAGTLRSAVSTGTITANVWNHVLVTYDGTNARFYFNGVLDSTIAPAGGAGNLMTHATWNLCIGRTDYGGNLIKGWATLPRVYNVTLGASVAPHHFNQEKHVLEGEI